jgi:hypothetical protein
VLKQQILTDIVNAFTLLFVSTISVIFLKNRKENSSSQSKLMTEAKIPEKKDGNSENIALIFEIFRVFIVLLAVFSAFSYLT